VVLRGRSRGLLEEAGPLDMGEEKTLPDFGAVRQIFDASGNFTLVAEALESKGT